MAVIAKCTRSDNLNTRTKILIIASTHAHIHKHVYTQNNHYSYCTYLHTNTYTCFTRIASTLRWSQTELLVGSFPVQFLLNYLAIFPMHIFLLNQPPPNHLHPSTKRSQRSLLTEEGWLQLQEMEAVLQTLHSLPPALYHSFKDLFLSLSLTVEHLTSGLTM